MPKVNFYLGDDTEPLNLKKKKDFKSYIQGATHLEYDSRMKQEKTFTILYYIKTCLKIC